MSQTRAVCLCGTSVRLDARITEGVIHTFVPRWWLFWGHPPGVRLRQRSGELWSVRAVFSTDGTAQPT
jgi:hypothetical protein